MSDLSLLNYYELLVLQQFYEQVTPSPRGSYLPIALINRFEAAGRDVDFINQGLTFFQALLNPLEHPQAFTPRLEGVEVEAFDPRDIALWLSRYALPERLLLVARLGIGLMRPHGQDELRSVSPQIYDRLFASGAPEREWSRIQHDQKQARAQAWLHARLIPHASPPPRLNDGWVLDCEFEGERGLRVGALLTPEGTVHFGPAEVPALLTCLDTYEGALIGHNLRTFDLPRLCQGTSDVDLLERLSARCLDTLELSTLLWPHAPRHRLEKLSEIARGSGQSVESRVLLLELGWGEIPQARVMPFPVIEHLEPLEHD